MKAKTMNTWTKLLCVLLCGALGGPSMATTCDVPLIVQQGTMPPNILIVLDSSGSMNEHIYHPDYDDLATYSGAFTRDTIYYYGSSTNQYKGPNYFKSGQPSTPTFLCSRGPNGQDGRYIGNYLNWIYFHATDAQRAAVPTLTRMHVAQSAINTVLTQAPGLRYGLMSFNGSSSGGTLHAAIGTSTASLITTVNGRSATGWTPSAECFMNAMDYFKRTDSSAPIQAECQESFIIFVTDGYPTEDRNIPAWIGDQDGDGMEPGDCESIGAQGLVQNCSHYLDDVAYYMARNDMRSDLDGDQFVYTYTIGFGIDAPLMALTALHGKGEYLLAWDLESLTNSLGIVVGDIVQRISAGAAVAVVSTESGDDNNLYRGKFLPGMWRGYLESYELPLDDDQSPVWEAGRILQERSASDREIFTSYGGTQIEFDANYDDQLLPYLGAADATEAANIINYARGEDIDGFRDRDNWKLGDLVYSTPVVVGGPSRFLLDPDYQRFLATYHDRQRMVYVGSNGGMMHAFRASDGHEEWAYAPLGTMHKLKDLMDPDYCHSTFVDLTPTVVDVKLGNGWRTVLIGGERTGGDSYFAIDITSPESPELMWEQSYPILGSSYTQPALVRTPHYTALWTGSAPDAGGNAYVNLIDLETGYLAVAAVLADTSADVNMMSGATAIDIDFDGWHDIVYQATLSGAVFRWVRDQSNNNWYGYRVFDTGGQPLQAKPSVAYVEGTTLLVAFGTGRYLDPSDVYTNVQQTFYGFKDDLSAYATYGPGDLTDQTYSINDTAGSAGWRFNLLQDGNERVVEPAAIVEGVVYFTSFAPNDDQCSAGGESWLYAVDYQSGAAIDPDTEEASDNISLRGESLGDGVASRPVIALGDGTLIVQTSDARLNIQDLVVPPTTMMVRSWRENTMGNASTYTSGNGEVTGQ